MKTTVKNKVKIRMSVKEYEMLGDIVRRFNALHNERITEYDQNLGTFSEKFLQKTPVGL